MDLLKHLALSFFGIVLISSFAGCTRHEVEIKPVEIKPIHITIDINVKIDKELDDFFGDLDEVQAEEAAETIQK